MSQSRQSLLHKFFLKLWYQQGLQSRLLAYCFLPLSSLFKHLASIKRIQDSKKAKRLSVPVIVVGNITVGGTGKTPVVIALAAALGAHNKRVGIISRGYGGSHDSRSGVRPLLVDAQTSAAVSGDESLLIAQQTQCPVAISRDRSEAAEYLLSVFPELDIIISDDGLQHYKLSRCLEIVVIDNKRGLGNQYCLPAGPLREPIERLEDVNWLIFNKQEGDACNSTQQTITSALPNIKSQLASVSLRPDTWLNIGMQTCYELNEPTWYIDHNEMSPTIITAIAAIGNPQRFFDTVASLNIKAIELAFDDHHKFSVNDFVADANNVVLMTAKDAVKCTGFANEYCWALNVSLQLPEPLIDDALRLINKPHNDSSNNNSSS